LLDVTAVTVFDSFSSFCEFLLVLKEVCSTHQGCIYLIKNTLKNVKYF